MARLLSNAALTSSGRALREEQCGSPVQFGQPIAAAARFRLRPRPSEAVRAPRKNRPNAPEAPRACRNRPGRPLASAPRHAGRGPRRILSCRCSSWPALPSHQPSKICAETARERQMVALRQLAQIRDHATQRCEVAAIAMQHRLVDAGMRDAADMAGLLRPAPGLGHRIGARLSRFPMNQSDRPGVLGHRPLRHARRSSVALACALAVRHRAAVPRRRPRCSRRGGQD